MSKVKFTKVGDVDCVVGSGMLKGKLGSVKVTNRQRVEPNEGVVTLLRIDGKGNRFLSEEFEEWFQEVVGENEDDLGSDSIVPAFEQCMIGDGWVIEEYYTPGSRGLVVLGKPPKEV